MKLWAASQFLEQMKGGLFCLQEEWSAMVSLSPFSLGEILAPWAELESHCLYKDSTVLKRTEQKDHNPAGSRFLYCCSVAQSCLTLCHLVDCSRPTISFSVAPFSSCLQSFPASWSFPMSRLFTSGGHSIGPSPSASVLPMNIQGWFPLGLTGLISLLSKEGESPAPQLKQMWRM